MTIRPEELGNQVPIRQSTIREIRNRLVQQFPLIEPFLEEVLPKKAPLMQYKFRGAYSNISIYTIAGKVVLLQDRDGPLVPHLRILHRCSLHTDPFMMKHMQIDKGGISFVIRGADVMCPGLTSPGGRLADVQRGEVVAVMAEGKQSALGIGLTLMTTAEMCLSLSIEVNKGKAIEAFHFLGDGFWNLSVSA